MLPICQLVVPSEIHANDSLANNSIFGHGSEVLGGDDVPVSGSGDEKVGTRCSILHSGDLVANHSRLQSIDGVDLSDENTGTV